MSKKFIAKVQKLSITEKTVLSHLIKSGTRPTTGSSLARKINIINSPKEADAITKKLEKAKMLRQSGDNGHVITKEFKADVESIDEMSKFSVKVAPTKEKPRGVMEPDKLQTSNPSTTVPTYVTFMENVMFLDKVSAVREVEYQADLAGVMKELGPKTLMLDSKETQDMRERAIDALNRKFYAYEMARYEEHQLKKIEKNTLDANSSKPNFSESDKKKLDQLNIELSSGMQSFMISGNFDSRRIEGLRKEYRHVISEIRQDAVALQPQGEYGSAAEHKAMVALFNDKYPSLNKELTKFTLENSKGMDADCAKAGRILLNVVSLAANPSGFLIGKGLKGILDTNAMSGFTKRIGSHVDRAMTTLGVKTNSKSYKLVGLAAAVAVMGVLTYALGDLETGVKFAREAAAAYGIDIGDAMVQDGIEVDSPEAPTPSAETPTLPAETPTPSAETPTPSAETPTPSAETPTPSAETPTPSAETPTPSAETPMPSAETPTPSAETSPFPVGEGGVYTVMPGDTLSEIVERQLKDAGIPYNYALIDGMVNQMAEANDIADKHVISPNMELSLTPIEGVDYSRGTVPIEHTQGMNAPNEMGLKNDDLIVTKPDYSEGPRNKSRMS
jgi:hypothetical protein